jgi:hypothetical protein
MGANQNYLSYFRVGEVETTDDGHIVAAIPGIVRVHDGDVHWRGIDRRKDCDHLRIARGHAEFRPAAQGTDHELALHLVGVSDQDRDRVRSGNIDRLHKPPSGGGVFNYVQKGLHETLEKGQVEVCDVAHGKNAHSCGKLARFRPRYESLVRRRDSS